MNGPDRTVASVTSVRSRLSGCGVPTVVHVP